MSLILDALKKSDRERRVAEGEPFAATSPAKRRSWISRSLFMLGLGATVVVALWVWRGGGAAIVDRFLNSETQAVAQPQTSETDSQAPLSQANEPPVGKVETKPATTQSTAAETPPARPRLGATAQPVAATTNQPDVPASTSLPVEETTVQPRERPIAQDRRNDRRRQRAEQRAAAAPKDPPPLELYQLPMGIRLQVPPVTMNVHVYAKQPEDRFVLLNMQRIEEGDELEGLIARTIRPDGVLLEFQGHQFLLRRP